MSEGDSALAQRVGFENVAELHGHFTLMDFSKSSRKRLLEANTVVFQGNRISLEELFGSQRVEDCVKFLNSETLEKVIRGQEFNVGASVLDLDEDTASHYIERTFVRKTKRTGAWWRDKFSEESIYQVNERFITIVDNAGVGKTTVLTKLAKVIKRKHPQLWVIRINLNDYTKVLRDSIKQNKKAINVMELLNSQQATKLTSDFEKRVFSTSGKIILMVDGLDEISPDYTDLMLGLLSQCKEESNLDKIFVTTRPHVAEEVEKTLNVESFEMLPFTRQNQTDFLVRYWTNNLALNDMDRNKCEKYAWALLNKISSWTYYKENTFTAIPLQVKMIAEIFQKSNGTTEWEGCKEYLEGHDEVPKIPKIFNIAELYDNFIEKNENIYEDKNCSGGNVPWIDTFKKGLNECLEYHHTLALKEILGEMESGLFASCPPMDKKTETCIIKFGIVQKLSDKFQFLHRTFAEYFVARSIRRELENKNANVDFQKLPIEILVKAEFGVVRTFLNNILKGVVDSLPSDIFENYKFSFKDNIITVLSREGHVEILRLILKSIDVKIMEGTEIEVEDWLDEKKIKRTNMLKDLQMIVRAAGLNFREAIDLTPLHWAVRKGHLEMVKFLVENGANINNREGDKRIWDVVKYVGEHAVDVKTMKSSGRTLLHSATEGSNLDVVKYLVERGADIYSTDSDGCSVLHSTAEGGNLDIFKYLVEQGVDVKSSNSSGQTVLLSAAEGSNLDVFKYMLEHGVDINSRDRYGRTILHLATEKSDLNVVKRLVEHGVDINARNNFSKTALQLAFQLKKYDIAEYLLQVYRNRDSDSD